MHFAYWGKRKKNGSWHHLCHHNLDVAAVVKVLLQKNPTWRTRLYALSPYSPEQTEALLLFLAACHDLGKFSNIFQFCLSPETVWNPPLERARPYVPAKQHHTELGLAIWEELCLPDFLPDTYTLEPLLTAALAHHGVPTRAAVYVNTAILPQQVKEDIQSYLEELGELFALSVFPQVDEQALCLLSDTAAGLFILADWIASNERWFSMDAIWIDAKSYFPKVERYAEQALEDLDFFKESAPREAGSFHDLLPHLPQNASPSPMQQAILDLPVPDGPELLVVEDLTGGGKTEAALLAAHRFLRSGQCSGLYVGLPTMATADAMYGRLSGSYQRMFANRIPLLLAHGGTQLNEDFLASIMPDCERKNRQEDESGGAICSQWLADNRKKALLSPCGVGTLDQALMAVIKARYQALRLFGLCRSVFIGDEVHSFDSYTGTLLKNLLKSQAALGGSAVLLTATLTQKLRREFVEAWAEGRAARGASCAVLLESENFPLLTRVTDGRCMETCVPTQRTLHVTVDSVHDEETMYRALRSVSDAGACACWVRNTVADVCEAYSRLTGKYGVPADKVRVFHARFAGVDRRDIETQVLKIFGKESTLEQRAGRILLASQVVEQSLDLDFDLLLSDLAPMDLLIQRAGRCHRHHGRLRPEGYGDAKMLVLTPQVLPDAAADWYAELFPRGQYVYPHHAELWRTAKILADKGKLVLPQDARELIEKTFDKENPAPGALIERDLKAEEEDREKQAKAHFHELDVCAGYLADAAEWLSGAVAPTRLGEPVQNVRLFYILDGMLRLWAGEEAQDMRTCLLSEVRVSKYHLKEVITPEESKISLDELCQQMPDKVRWCTCLVLQEDENGIWKGQGKNGRNQEVTVRYSKGFGFEARD
ncbi:MAG: CRISPR-associated helicase Cas3' [bacterium]|nr:CRISPR-associated helicase Cas3' [bacterium]